MPGPVSQSYQGPKDLTDCTVCKGKGWVCVCGSCGEMACFRAEPFDAVCANSRNATTHTERCRYCVDQQ